MKEKKYWILAVSLAVCVAVMGTAKLLAYLPIPGSGPLAGLEGVGVAVKMDSPQSIEKYGLTEERLKTVVGLQLRRNGITVLNNWLDATGRPLLLIKVWASIREKIELAAVWVRIEFREDGLLVRNPKIPVNAVTWVKLRRGFCTVKELEDIPEDIKDMVDEFIKDYLTANPKERREQKE